MTMGTIQGWFTFGTLVDDNFRSFVLGKSVTYHYQTNDPRVTQPALLLISLLMFMAAIFMIAFAALFHAMTVMFFGIIFLIFLIIFFVSNIRAIRRVEKEIQDRKGQ